MDLFYLCKAEWAKFYSKERLSHYAVEMYTDLMRVNGEKDQFKIISKGLKQANGMYMIDVAVETYRGA